MKQALISPLFTLALVEITWSKVRKVEVSVRHLLGHSAIGSAQRTVFIVFQI